MGDNEMYDDDYEPDEGQYSGNTTYGYTPDAGGGDFDTLPAIVYLAEVESWEVEPASTGTLQFVVRLRVLEPEQHKARVIFWRTNVGEKYDWTRKSYFAAIGYDVGAPFQWTPDQQVGREVGLLLEHQKGQSRVFEKPKEFFRVTDPRVPGHEQYAEE